MPNMRARFTILGETGSGKTCYLLGMCDAMSSDIAGYTIDSNDDEQRSDLSKRYANLSKKEMASDRFPP